MIKLVTLLAVVDMCDDDKDGSTELDSSCGETCPLAAEAAAWFFPKPSFHLECFFVTGAATFVTVGGGGVDKIAEGKANILTGSNTLGLESNPTELIELLEEGALLALLISLTRDCDAAARLRHVSSCKLVGLVG